ncbi:hypothetical protein TKK_0017079 [Trichogramma kaykai]
MAPSSRQPFGRKSAAILTALYHLNDEERKALLKKANPTLVKNICECALNVLAGNVTLSSTHKAKLRKHVCILRKLSEPRIKLARKKKFSYSKGDFYRLYWRH